MCRRFCRIEPTTFAPAVLAREASSPNGSRGSALDLGRMTPTRTARSWRTESLVRLSSATGGFYTGCAKSPRRDALRFSGGAGRSLLGRSCGRPPRRPEQEVTEETEGSDCSASVFSLISRRLMCAFPMMGATDTNPPGAVAARVGVVNVSPFDKAQGWPLGIAQGSARNLVGETRSCGISTKAREVSRGERNKSGHVRESPDICEVFLRLAGGAVRKSF